MAKTMMFNPYTGTPRHPSDIASDPAGLLILDDGEPLRAAPKAEATGQADKAEEKLERLLWDAIDFAAKHPREAKLVDPRTWEHLLVYSTKAEQSSLDPTKIQLCRLGAHSADALAMVQPCNCPEGTCRLWNGGLPSPDAEAEATGQAEPFAWATFDGEGGYDLLLYADNESHHEDFIKRNGDKYAGWVVPLYEHPPKAAQPLTDDKVQAIREEVFSWALARCDGCDDETWDQWFARAVQRACAEAWGVKLAGIGGEGKA